MTTATYKGRKIKLNKGRFGYTRVNLNGEPMGEWLGSESAVRTGLERQIDHIDTAPVDGDRWPALWYAPGTFELCAEGHPKTIGEDCRHRWCVEHR